MKINFKNKTILITGGTGSFGTAFINYILKVKESPKKIIVFSRDELKQFEMKKFFDQQKFSNIRYFLGDIRDKDRLNFSLKNVLNERNFHRKPHMLLEII